MRLPRTAALVLSLSLLPTLPALATSATATPAGGATLPKPKAAVSVKKLNITPKATRLRARAAATVTSAGIPVGSLPLGQATYAVPAGAIHAAPWGTDTNSGTASAPVKTIARALTLVPTNGTVVLRGGLYSESVTVRKTVTIQNAPGEVVWIDGADEVKGWVQDGGRWRVDGWTTRFDHSPTYTKGAADSTNPGWQFVNPKTPMAAHPDQVYVDGYAQWQVGSLSQLTPGTFYLDEATSKLYLGSDPTGKLVQVTKRSRAMAIQAPDVTVRGIGMRRFGNSVWMVGAVTMEQPRIALENVVVTDMATTGISMLNTDQKLTRVSVEWSGMMGIHTRYADRLTLRQVSATKNNSQYFNAAPNAGGMKLGATRGVKVFDSSFSGNFAYGFWEDLSVYDSVIARSQFNDNDNDGLFLEISAKAIVADNTFAGNKGFGLKVNNTSDVQVWNNTFVGNSRPLNLVQDTRRNTNPYDQAVDKRQAFPDPTMPWTLGPVTVRNNVFGPGSTGNCVLCVEDYGFKMSGEAMKISTNSNVYNRTSTTSPSWLAVWSSGSTNPFVFTTLTAFRTKTGQETRSVELTGTPQVGITGTATSTLSTLEPSVAEPLPSGIATLIDKPAGSRHLGRW